MASHLVEVERVLGAERHRVDQRFGMLDRLESAANGCIAHRSVTSADARVAREAGEPPVGVDEDDVQSEG